MALPLALQALGTLFAGQMGLNAYDDSRRAKRQAALLERVNPQQTIPQVQPSSIPGLPPIDIQTDEVGRSMPLTPQQMTDPQAGRGAGIQANLVREMMRSGQLDKAHAALLPPQPDKLGDKMQAALLFANPNTPQPIRDAISQFYSPMSVNQSVTTGATTPNPIVRTPAEKIAAGLVDDNGQPIAGLWQRNDKGEFKPVWQPPQVAESEAKSAAQADVSSRLMEEVSQFVDPTNPNYVDPSSNWTAFKAWMGSSPVTSWVTELTPQEAKLASNLVILENMMIAAMRGAAVGPQEQKMFIQQLPVLGQDDALFRANLENTKKNLRELQTKQRQYRSQPTGEATTIPQPGLTREALETQGFTYRGNVNDRR